MRKQRGLTLTGLLFWGMVIAVAAIMGMKVVPEVVDYYKLKKIVASTALAAEGKTVPEIRAIYAKYAEVDHIEVVQPADLDISKEGNQIVVAFEYQSVVPLFANVSLLIDFKGSSAQR
ncbi:MAG: DUF4845 domain-containing protein [Candidatus Accumulibacter sp.]|jgi:Tfp pilus assembly major pilin PilA|nr:DUF4845 domain-containing protein [Accumulibacter sp.]